jgi:hypothetical protein
VPEDLTKVAFKYVAHDTLIVVTAPHFCAALVMMDGAVVRTAPILKWALGWKADRLSAYFKRKGWKAIQRACPAVIPGGLGGESDGNT